MNSPSIFSIVRSLFDHPPKTDCVFHPGRRNRPIRGDLVGVERNYAMIRTLVGRVVRLPLVELPPADRHLVQRWLRKHAPLHAVPDPDIKVTFEKRIYLRSINEALESAGFDLFFDVTVSNESEHHYDDIVLTYTTFGEFQRLLSTWQRGEQGEMRCSLAPGEKTQLQVAGSIEKSGASYEPETHRILVNVLVDEAVIVKASDSPRLLFHHEEQDSDDVA